MVTLLEVWMAWLRACVRVCVFLTRRMKMKEGYMGIPVDVDCPGCVAGYM